MFTVDNSVLHTFQNMDAPVSPYVMIIDPGHGGEDGGAVSVTGTYESTINLSISQKLKAIADLYGIPVVMTRNSDEIVYPENANTVKSRKKADQDARIDLINKIEHGILISIHQNKFTDSGPFGAQVLYAPTNGSEELAILLQESLVNNLNTENYRTAVQISDSIYLFKNISCTAVMVECGFLSNPDEADMLDSESYRLKIASVIAASFCDYIGVVK
jgi:N-acetylmuramoyl-L-alanine amidase